MNPTLRPALEVWEDAYRAWDDAPIIPTHLSGADEAAASIIETDRTEVAHLTEQRVKAYWYRQGKDDAWEAVVDQIATWLEAHEFGEDELHEASITIAGFIRAGEWKK